MKDVHVHFLHGYFDNYTTDYFEGLITTALSAGMDEICLLEHNFQFFEFDKVYEPIRAYNPYQQEWISNKMNGSIERYLRFIESIKPTEYPISIKFGLEVCFIPETAETLSGILSQYDFDFITGSVHWIDGWGFDHSQQREIWETVDVEKIYIRYYEIMRDLCASELFDGLAHPDSIKCFGYLPPRDMSDEYIMLADELNRQSMYAENSGGLRLNYNPDLELGLNEKLLNVFKTRNVRILPASDAHKQSDVGANIPELLKMIGGDEK